MYHIFIHSSVDQYLGCLHFLATVNSAIMNIGVHTPFKIWLSPVICPAIGLLDQIVVLFLVFKVTSILFSILTIPVYLHTISVGGFPFLDTLSSIYCLRT